MTFTGRVAFYPGDHYQLSDCWVTPSAVTSLTKDDWLDPSVMRQHEGQVVSIRDLLLTEIGNDGAHYRYPEGNDFIYCRFPLPAERVPLPQWHGSIQVLVAGHLEAGGNRDVYRNVALRKRLPAFGLHGYASTAGTRIHVKTRNRRQRQPRARAPNGKANAVPDTDIQLCRPEAGTVPVGRSPRTNRARMGDRGGRNAPIGVRAP